MLGWKCVLGSKFNQISANLHKPGWVDGGS